MRGYGDMCRIIPAYAGSTKANGNNFINGLGSSPHTRGARMPPTNAILSVRDHPRIRGEHELVNMRKTITFGIIPAYAGSTP